MSADLFVLVALGALLVFIFWEIWANRRSALRRRVEAADGFVPGGAARELALFILAAVFLACSVLVFAAPDLASSRYGYLLRALEAWFGPLMPPVLFLAVAAGILVTGVSARRRRIARKSGHAG